MVDDLETAAKEMKSDVVDLNKDLTWVLSKMREPGKLCMDITLMIVLAIVLGILVWAVTYYIKLKYRLDHGESLL